MKLIEQKLVAGFVVTAQYFTAHVFKCGLEHVHSALALAWVTPLL